MYQFIIALLASIASGWLTLLILKLIDHIALGVFSRPKKIDYPLLWPKIAGVSASRLDELCAWSSLSKKQLKRFVLFILSLFIFALFFGSLFAFFVGLLVSMVVVMQVALRMSKNKQRFILGLPDTLGVLTASLKAGFSLPQALLVVERESVGVSKYLFGSLVRAGTFRVPLYKAAKDIAVQVKMQEWDMVSEGFVLQGKVGGNIIQLFEDIAETLRDKSRVEREVSSATAAGRLSGAIIACLGPLSFVVFYFFAPSFIEPMLTSWLGRSLLGLAFLLDVLGFYVIWKITSIDF